MAFYYSFGLWLYEGKHSCHQTQSFTRFLPPQTGKGLMVTMTRNNFLIKSERLYPPKYHQRYRPHFPLQIGRNRKGSHSFRTMLGIVAAVYCWIFLLSYLYAKQSDRMVAQSTNGTSKNKSRSKGIVISLKKLPHLCNFIGFETVPLNPTLQRLKSQGSFIWLLKPEIPGRITVNSTSYLEKITHVSVQVRYFVSAPSTSWLRVSGRNKFTHESVTAELSQYGSSYCTRVLYLGMVQEVSYITL